MLEYPVLLGDIGGTNARFAILLDRHSAAISLPNTFTGQHPGPVEAIRAILQGEGYPSPRSALIAVATRVDHPTVQLTNAAWTIDAARIGTDLNLSGVTIVNDYVPVAASLTTLRLEAGELVRLGPEIPNRAGARLVLGPGTGLGAAALLPNNDGWLVHPTEAGHVDFGPSNEIEMALWPLVDTGGGRMTAETILSGPGLLRLHQAHARSVGATPTCVSPEAVTEAGLNGADRLAGDTLHLFVRLLGRFAGDLALIFGATGGVSIGSGIAPTLMPILSGPHFRASFEDKAPFGSLLRSIATFVIVHPTPALAGLCAIATDPDRFSFDRQGWTRQGTWNSFLVRPGADGRVS